MCLGCCESASVPVTTSMRKRLLYTDTHVTVTCLHVMWYFCTAPQGLNSDSNGLCSYIAQNQNDYLTSWFLDELILSVWHPCLTVKVLWSVLILTRADVNPSSCGQFFHFWSFNLVLRNEMQARLCEMLLNQEARLSADRDSTVRGWMRFKASRKTLGSLLCLRLGWQAIQIVTPTFRKSFCCPL